jgi:hypothetical protein
MPPHDPPKGWHWEVAFGCWVLVLSTASGPRTWTRQFEAIELTHSGTIEVE